MSGSWQRIILCASHKPVSIFLHLQTFQHLLQSVASCSMTKSCHHRQANYSLASVWLPLRLPFRRLSPLIQCKNMFQDEPSDDNVSSEHAPTLKSALIYLLKERIWHWQKIVRWPDAIVSNGWHLLGHVLLTLLLMGLIAMQFVCVFIESPPAMGTVFIPFPLNFPSASTASCH